MGSSPFATHERRCSAGRVWIGTHSTRLGACEMRGRSFAPLRLRVRILSSEPSTIRPYSSPENAWCINDFFRSCNAASLRRTSSMFLMVCSNRRSASVVYLQWSWKSAGRDLSKLAPERQGCNHGIRGWYYGDETLRKTVRCPLRWPNSAVRSGAVIILIAVTIELSNRQPETYVDTPHPRTPPADG